jgi:hypothetical protein
VTRVTRATPLAPASGEVLAAIDVLLPIRG